MIENKGKMVFLLGSMNRGGAERVVSILSNYFVDRGWEIDLILFLDSTVQYKMRENIRIIDFSKKSAGIISLLYWLYRLRSYVKKERPRIIISFVARINLIALVSTYGLKKKIIISERNDPAKDGRSFLIKVATRLFYTQANRIVFQTCKAKECFSASIQRKGCVIPNPIRIYESKIEPTRHKIVTVGRLAPQKNQQLLIEAFKDVVDKYTEYELWIYGEGYLRDELEKQIVEFGLTGKAHLPGNFADIHHQIADAEMFVLSSDYEGLSNALLEAMMMGLPCISTNCSGIDEYITNEKTGLLVPIGDKDNLKKAILRYIENPDLRNKLALSGKKRAYSFEASKVLQQWEKLINELI